MLKKEVQQTMIKADEESGETIKDKKKEHNTANTAKDIAVNVMTGFAGVKAPVNTTKVGNQNS
jgi:hypothetical protein